MYDATVPLPTARTVDRLALRQERLELAPLMDAEPAEALRRRDAEVVHDARELRLPDRRHAEQEVGDPQTPLDPDGVGRRGIEHVDGRSRASGDGGLDGGAGAASGDGGV
jgi:hypothetical protein